MFKNNLRQAGNISRIYTARIATRSLYRTAFTLTKPILNHGLVNKPITLNLRNYSVLTTNHEAKLYEYEQVKDLVDHPEKHPESLLIDVREPIEFKDGHIPHAINIPFKSSPGALDLSPEDFEENFGFEKPDKSKELVFYCLGGIRSTAAEELANTFGYPKRGNYVGSWEDWVARENAKKN